MKSVDDNSAILRTAHYANETLDTHSAKTCTERGDASEDYKKEHFLPIEKKWPICLNGQQPLLIDESIMVYLAPGDTKLLI